MQNNRVMLSLNEIGLLPSSYPTDIDSRSKINPTVEDDFFENTITKKLPIFVSPMTSVLDDTNFETFEKQSKFIPIMPRIMHKGNSNDFLERFEHCKQHWTAFSLPEFEKLVNGVVVGQMPPKYVLVDIANGHIGKLYELARQFKEKYPESKLMVGNIAHPRMFLECCKVGIDYVRVGIGGGSVCSTSVQCGVHSSHVWFIEECKKYSEYMSAHRTKLIADGGINTLDKAIKCLAIGYDYVMMGRQFAQCEEACGETDEINCQKKYPQVAINSVSIIDIEKLKLSDDGEDPLAIKDIPGTGQIVRKYYGMASEQGQIDISGGCNKNPEGIETWVPVNTNLKHFGDKFEAALRSTMSYVGAHNLDELRCTEYMPMTKDEFDSYYK